MSSSASRSRWLLVSQDYAAENAFHALSEKKVHETAVAVGGYLLGKEEEAPVRDGRQATSSDRPRGTTNGLLRRNVGCTGAGEFGVLIAERPGMSWETQFQALHQHFFNVGNRTKALLLSTYVKFVNLYPESRDLIGPVFDKYAPSVELELQQRACEYQRLAGAGDDVLEIVLAGACVR